VVKLASVASYVWADGLIVGPAICLAVLVGGAADVGGGNVAGGKRAIGVAGGGAGTGEQAAMHETSSKRVRRARSGGRMAGSFAGHF